MKHYRNGDRMVHRSPRAVLASSAINKDVHMYSEKGAGAGAAGRRRWIIKHCLFALRVVVFFLNDQARVAARAHVRATHATRATHAHALAGS